MRTHYLEFFRKPSWVTYFMIGILSISCSVQFPSSYIYARDYETDYIHKWPLFTEDEENYRIELEPLENVDEMLPFEVTILNKGKDPLFVDPSSWQLWYANEYTEDITRMDTVSYPLTGNQLNEAYQDIANRIEKAKKRTKTALIVVGVVLIIGVIILVTAIDSDDDEKKEKKRVREKRRVRRSGGIVNLSFNFQPATSSERERWTEEDEIAYFRRSGEQLRLMDLGPRKIHQGDTYRFLLFFPRKESMKYLVMDGRINHQLYRWNFLHDTKETFR